MHEIDDIGRISTRHAATILNVHESTIKRWCNEALLEYSLTAGGHRRLQLDSLMDFARARNLDVPLSWFRGFESDVWNAWVEFERKNYDDLINLTSEWVTTNRIGYVYRLVMFLESVGMTWRELCDHFLARMMHKVGDDWSSGCTSVDEEHFFTEVVSDIIQFRRHANQFAEGGPKKVADRTAILGCPGSELHQLGLLMVRVVLEEQGWNVIFIGPNVPLLDLAAAQKKYNASLLGLSFSSVQGGTGIGRATELLAAVYDPATPYSLVLGGSALISREPDIPSSDTFADVNVFRDMISFGAYADAYIRPEKTAASRDTRDRV